MMPFSHKPMHMADCGPHHWGPPIRECRRELKELLVDRTTRHPANEAVIGGGCCVQLSVEYMPAKPVNLEGPASGNCSVSVAVVDSEGCSLTWLKIFHEGYHVKESIITTYPGARLTVTVTGAIARVRWCEIFSC